MFRKVILDLVFGMDLPSPVTKQRAASQSKSNRAEVNPSCTSSNKFLLNSHLWLLDNLSDPDGLYWLSLEREFKGNLSAESHLWTSSHSVAFISHYHIQGRQTSVVFLGLVSRRLSRQSFPVTWNLIPNYPKISLHQLKCFFVRKNTLNCKFFFINYIYILIFIFFINYILLYSIFNIFNVLSQILFIDYDITEAHLLSSHKSLKIGFSFVFLWKVASVRSGQG